MTNQQFESVNPFIITMFCGPRRCIGEKALIKVITGLDPTC